MLPGNGEVKAECPEQHFFLDLWYTFVHPLEASPLYTEELEIYWPTDFYLYTLWNIVVSNTRNSTVPSVIVPSIRDTPTSRPKFRLTIPGPELAPPPLCECLLTPGILCCYLGCQQTLNSTGTCVLHTSSSFWHRQLNKYSLKFTQIVSSRRCSALSINMYSF